MYRFTYKNEEYYYNPENPIITGMDPDTGEMLEGDKLRDVLGMTDEEAQRCHATGLLNELRCKRDELIKETEKKIINHQITDNEKYLLYHKLTTLKNISQ